MKLLLATSKAVPSGGGIASYNQELIKAFREGNDFYLLTSADEHNVEGFKESYSLYGGNIFDFSYAKQIIDKINAEGFSLIINSDSYFISIAAPFLKTPIVSVAHFMNGIAADCAGYNSDYNNAIIALSYYCKAYLVKKFSINPPDKVKVIYNFVKDTNNNFCKCNNDRIKIVYPGGTSIEKSVDVVMDVAYRLKKTKLDFSFVWLGGTTLPSANFSLLGLKDIRQMLHGDERFTITGNVPREEAERIIASANIFLLPSRGEGCPMTLLEAMREGCIPIVSDAHHGSRELIEKSGAGFVLKQGDSRAIVERIQDIIYHHKNYFGYYSKSKSFSETELSSAIWKSQMNLVIQDALVHPKKCIELEANHYNILAKGYKKLIHESRKTAMINSAINRFKMDWLYIKWKGWR